MSWRASVLTLFPGMFPGPLGVSLAGRAREREARTRANCGAGRFSVEVRPSIRDGRDWLVVAGRVAIFTREGAGTRVHR